MITFTATGRSAAYASDDLLTSGSVGIPVTLELSSDFAGLSCVAVFRGSGVTVDVALTGSSCTVPHEVLASACGVLEIGIYARDAAGTVVIPTIWAAGLPIQTGAAPSGVDPAEPTPDWTAQVQQIATEALETANSVRADADAGEFDGPPGQEGPPGPQGATGATPDISIGTVTTLPAGADATASMTGTPEEPVLNLGIPKGDPGEVTLAEFYKVFPTDTASGAVASFPDGADDIPVKSLTANIEAVQTGSGAPAPDNIRPISGWTGLTLNISGADTTDPTTYEVDWTDETGVVYGGTLNMTTGVLTVDRLGFVFDGTEAWTSQFSGDNNCFRFTVSGIKCTSEPRACSHYENVTVTSGNSGVGYYAYTSGSLTSVFIQIRPDHSAIPSGDLDAWKAWLAAQHAAGTPVTCWFQPLEAYYQTYQLDPVVVRTLLGANNIWADTGDVTVKYRADVGLYIDKVLAAQ